jgi:stress-induced-phosphoprotein 1
VKAWAKKGDCEFFMKEFHKAMESYQRGLNIDPQDALCSNGLQKVVAKINQSSTEEETKER